MVDKPNSKLRTSSQIATGGLRVDPPVISLPRQAQLKSAVATSSGEAEFDALTKGASRALGG